MIAIDPFTTAGPEYRKGARVKMQMALPSQVPLWGTVIRNDGKTFEVEWDFPKFTGLDNSKHDCDVERQRYEGAGAEFIGAIEVARERRDP